jgi:CDP-glycerol glycerophosphotransferase
MRARHADFFDPEEVIAALPDDVFVLMRGHAFHARMRNYRRAGAERILDVTDYPDVNDLILASDVAVLDYSSLRFDYALTDKPMVFLVPDAAKYDEVRGGVIPFAPTAPGPHVSSTDEVISHLKDLDVLRSSFAADRRRFRADYTELDDGHAAARLVDAVFVPRGDAPPA